MSIPRQELFGCLLNNEDNQQEAAIHASDRALFLLFSHLLRKLGHRCQSDADGDYATPY